MPRITTPVTVITGFLGAGKTTLINRILREMHGERLAVIENEFGAVGVDAQFLVTDHDETVIQLANGCLCCTVRGDLARALNQLATQCDAGAFHFDRVLIETTGVADPGPIIQTFLAETAILTRFHLDGVVTLVDAVHGLADLTRVENRAQIAYADRLLLTKSDQAATEVLVDALRCMNPRAQCLPIDLHRSDLRDVMTLLFDACAYTFDHIAHDELARLRGSIGLMQSASSDRLRPLSARLHSERIVSCVFDSEQPLDLARLNHFFDTAMQRFGTRLWRIKGIVHADRQTSAWSCRACRACCRSTAAPSGAPASRGALCWFSSVRI